MAQMLVCPKCGTKEFPPVAEDQCQTCGSDLVRGRIPSEYDGPRPAKKVRYKSWHSIVLRDPCAYCDADSNSIDHITPKDLGGERHAWYNKAGSCRECNSRKSNVPLLLWLIDRGTGLSSP